jgi:hypothetical protein
MEYSSEKEGAAIRIRIAAGIYVQIISRTV